LFKILDYLLNDILVNAVSLSRKLCKTGFSKSSIKRAISKLKNEGVIAFKGAAKTGKLLRMNSKPDYKENTKNRKQKWSYIKSEGVFDWKWGNKH